MKKDSIYKKGNVEIKRFDGSDEVKQPLAAAYMRSYNNLSRAYKSPKEMEKYTSTVFMNKLDNYSKDENSDMFVVFVDEKPRGFVRYSPIPEYYKNPKDGVSQEKESGVMDGYEYAWVRKVNFTRDQELNDQTACVNQIYMDPTIQNQGLGTTLLKETLPIIQEERGFDNIIIEYNAQNERAKRFYMYTLGLEKLAETKDFDHIIEDDDGKAVNCISDVEIAHNTIDGALGQIRKIENSRYKEPTETANFRNESRRSR